jgi:hypothetical protein
MQSQSSLFTSEPQLQVRAVLINDDPLDQAPQAAPLLLGPQCG